MNRLDFIEKIGCQNDMDEHFDILMSAYDVINKCKIKDIEYEKSNSLTFTLSSINENDVENITSYLSRVEVSSYGKKFDLDVKQNESIIKLIINDRAAI